MSMPRLPQTLRSSGLRSASKPKSQSFVVTAGCCSGSAYSTLAFTGSTAAAKTSLVGTARQTAAPTSNSGCMTNALGQCRIAIRNKHQVNLNNKHYSQLATAAHSASPPPSSASNPLQHQRKSQPIHMSASTFPSNSQAATAASITPESSPLFRMNNPASIVQQRQPRRRYSPQHFYQNRILDPYVNQAANPITLRQLVFFGRNMQEDKLLKSANYVRTELPVRLAHRIRDFQNLPFIVGTNPHIELVYDLYWQAFEKLSKVPEIKTLEENDAFCDLIKALLNDHLVVIPQLALGIMECSKHIPAGEVDRFMNKMLRSRISRRVLAEQHISLTANYNSPNHMMTDRGYIGIIYTHCRPRDIVERTALLAAETCRQATGGLEPPIVMLDGNIDAEFSYIPDHIEYILYELLKNSMRFVMQNGIPDPKTGSLPPIQITVCEGTHDIVFRISDKGGGIPPDMEAHLWSYSQSPARFANFEKISKMAATVQEQLVSPSRSVNSGSDNEKITLEADSESEGITLPPPPPTNKSSSTDTPNLLLDRHAPPRVNKTSSTSASSSSSASSSFSTSSSQSQHPHQETVIDPSQSPAPSTKPGHLDTEARQYKDKSMHLGIGLPMSRVYAEYWGGDLKVFTMHGYGTDAYARFCKFGNIYENFDV
ncbi:hypothetical protein BGX21_001302 [Mortierella sp. AD011]|nr:hypothetical protein BGX20_001189 [Mortierella sp. AD010]KAF9401572.1 hypothetical protein BGX21_001302 [Mortierella sp. AD011]